MGTAIAVNPFEKNQCKALTKKPLIQKEKRQIVDNLSLETHEG